MAKSWRAESSPVPPFSAKHLLQALPGSVRSVAVLDRTKEPGAQAEPLYLDVMTALAEAFNNGERETLPRVIGGRYGLSSKEFGPDCVLAVFAELNAAKPKARFTVGIYDDVTNLSLPLPENTLPNSAKLEALFYGLGSDGSVSATKTISRLSVIPRRGTHRAILFTTPKGGRPDGFSPSSERTADSFRLSHFPG